MGPDTLQSKWRTQGPHQEGQAVNDFVHLAPDPFIVATSQDSIKPSIRSRKFIRRHVMKGKNRKRVNSQFSALGSWINHGRNPSASSHLNWPNGLAFQRTLVPYLGLQKNCLSASGMCFRVEMEPCMVRLIYDCGSLLAHFAWSQLLTRGPTQSSRS